MAKCWALALAAAAATVLAMRHAQVWAQALMLVMLSVLLRGPIAISPWRRAGGYGLTPYYLLGAPELRLHGVRRIVAVLHRLSRLVAASMWFILAIALLAHFGVARARGTSGDSLTFAFVSEQFAWNAVDAVPGLGIPDAFNWKLEHPFTDHLSGAVFVLYKAMVLLPLVSLLVAGLRRAWENAGHRPDEPRAASASPSGGASAPPPAG